MLVNQKINNPMKILKITFIAFLVFSLTTSCFEDRDDNAISASEISDFVWKGMNAFYLYKDEIPNLANDRFSTNEEYASYLDSYSGPEELFESLIYQRQTIDRFSVLVDDYIALEQLLSGTTKNNGMKFGLVQFSGSDDLFGYVRYVLPNSDAETKGVQRGMLFNAVNGTQLTINNYQSLLNTDAYTINLATYNDNGTSETSDDTITSSSESIALIKNPYTENPIFINDVLTIEDHVIGYLMYNGFTGTDQFDSQLNSVFAEFQAAGITDLVLDLRYNGGGSVATATWLASMITSSSLTGSTFFTEQYNSDLQAQFLAENPDFLVNPFVNEMIKRNNSGEIVFQQNINHVNLDKVYVLTTRSTASASELVINGLRPHIEVVQIGTTTTGKYQASITVYDSPDFRRAGANPNHTYALQPLIYKSLNANGFTDFDSGLAPNIVLGENFGNLGMLGNVNEPYLAAAINEILNSGRYMYPEPTYRKIIGSNELEPFSNDMYTTKQLPSYLNNRSTLEK